MTQSGLLQQLKGKPNDLERFIHLMNLLETAMGWLFRSVSCSYTPEAGCRRRAH